MLYLQYIAVSWQDGALSFLDLDFESASQLVQATQDCDGGEELASEYWLDFDNTTGRH